MIAFGAILYFATNLRIAHVDVDTVGLILMLAGLAGLVLGLVQQGIWSRRSRRDVALGRPGTPPQPPS
jgi:predicted MFS family arabinose efflux permease